MGKKTKRPSRTQSSKTKASSSEKESKKETLASLAESNSSVTSSPYGLQNIGNTCYFNSTIQAIACSRRYLEYKLNEMMIGDVSERKVNLALYSFLSQLKSSKAGATSAKNNLIINPSTLLSAVCVGNPQFRGRSQQDAHELYVCLMATLKEEYEKMMKSCPLSEAKEGEESTSIRPLSSVYDGTLCSLVKCKECDSKFATCESFFDISMPIPGSEALMVIRRPVIKPLFSAKKSPSVAGGSIVVEDLFASSGDETKEDDEEEESEQVDKVEKAEPVIDAVAAATAVDDQIEEDESINQKLSELTLSLKADEDLIASAPEHSTSLADEIIEAPIHLLREITRETRLSILDSLDLFTKEEILSVEQGNGFFCSQCQRKVDASRRLMPMMMPRGLVLHLKRLLPSGKYDRHVDFPLSLDLSDYLAKSTRHDTAASTSCDYSLVSVIVHQGSGRGGHYVCYSKYKGIWFYTSDSIVRRSNESEVLAAQAYMLFYAQVVPR
jgi:ubiquitin C-terminal hydrolase